MSRLLFLISISSLIMGCEPEVGFQPVPDNPQVETDPEGSLGEGPIEDEIRIPEAPLLQGPVVRFPSPPADGIDGDDVDVPYEIIVGDAPIVDVICTVDGVLRACSMDGGVIHIPAPGQGAHVVVVEAVDENGIKDDSNVGFDIFDRFVRHIQNISVESANRTQSDILFVIDNSGSMAEEQRNIGDNFKSFIKRLEGLDWRIAITTTESSATPNYGDGKLVPFANGNYYLTSNMNPEQAQDLFSKAVERPETGNPEERGIRSVYRSIERAFNPVEAIDRTLAAFFRKDAALSVVMVSDEDETLGDVFGNNFADVEKSFGFNLEKLVAQSWGVNKNFRFSSIITRPGDFQCLNDFNGYRYGKYYQELSLSTGGIVGDICAPDYGSQLDIIGENVAELVTVYPLACVPQDLRRQGAPNFDVESKSGGTVPNYRLDGDKVIFDQPLDPGDYKLVYFCLNPVS